MQNTKYLFSNTNDIRCIIYWNLTKIIEPLLSNYSWVHFFIKQYANLTFPMTLFCKNKNIS